MEMPHPLIWCFGQRWVVVLGGNGGLKYQSWKHQTYQLFAHRALHGTRGASLVRNDR